MLFAFPRISVSLWLEAQREGPALFLFTFQNIASSSTLLLYFVYHSPRAHFSHAMHGQPPPSLIDATLPYRTLLHGLAYCCIHCVFVCIHACPCIGMYENVLNVFICIWVCKCVVCVVRLMVRA